MTDRKIYYRSGYKYQLAEDYHATTAIRPPADIVTEFVLLDTLGNLILKDGYAWDGPSGPTIDDSTNMRASAGHDAKYQIMREGLIPRTWRDTADVELHEELLEDGMNPIRAELWFLAVRGFALDETDPKHDRKIQTAP